MTALSSSSAGLHRYILFLAMCTFLLLVAGALVTSNDAGLSIPDWPLAYGTLVPPLVGGIRYEFGHRVIASFVGLLTTILAGLLWRYEPRKWVRSLGWAALGIVVAQGILGGLTVRMFQPPAVSAAHATFAQLFFCTVVSLVLFTGRWWRSDLEPIGDPASPRIATLAIAAVVAVFLQLVLGAVFRHRGFGIVPHLVGAAVVTVLLFWLAGALRRRFRQAAPLRGSARLLHILLGLQLGLGGAAWWSRVWNAEFPQPMPLMVGLTVAHTVVGALLLAATLIVTLISGRIVRPVERPAVASRAEHAAS